MQVLQVYDGFLWADVTEKAKDIFQLEMFELYNVNYENESLIEDIDTLNELLENGTPIYMELCPIQEIKQLN
jgi:hypothetical protein